MIGFQQYRFANIRLSIIVILVKQQGLNVVTIDY